MPTASTLEIFSTVGKLVTAISDIPALSVLKPIGSLLVTICEHVEALESNKDAAITLVKRVNRVVEVLTNRAQNMDGVVPGNYSDDIKSLEDVLVNIATALEKSRRRKWLDRMLFPKADTAKLSDLSSDLDDAIKTFGLAADLEARLTYQTIRAHFLKGGSELHSPTINTSALRVFKELYATDNYSVQAGTYANQAVVVKKYYLKQEERFAQDLRQRRNLIHPGIACIIGSSDGASVMLLCAEALILCPQNTIDISRVRDPWKHRRIGPQIVTGDMGKQSRSTSHPVPYPSKMMRPQIETLTVKESDTLLQQFIGVVQFLGKMKVEVAWWEFKPSWVGLRGENQLILIDWDQDSKSTMGGEFEPRYAIHVIGLGFSDVVPEAFQDSGRLLENIDKVYNGRKHFGGFYPVPPPQAPQRWFN